MNTMYKKRYMTCINCGCIGHTSKLCNYPITSYGVICCKNTCEGTKYLMIQKKDSMAFVDFMRGKYIINDIEFLLTLFENMTKFEKESLLSENFDDLWFRLWTQTYKKPNRDFKESKDKYEKLLKGFKIKRLNGKLEFINLFGLINKSNDKYIDSEWEFPKGRRYMNEIDINCAIREFCEETLIKNKDINILTNKQFYEIYIGTNNIGYRNVYYVGICDGYEDICIDENNLKQIQEVKDIKWMTIDECIKNTREVYSERKNMIQRLDKQLSKYFLELSKK